MACRYGARRPREYCVHSRLQIVAVYSFFYPYALWAMLRVCTDGHCTKAILGNLLGIPQEIKASIYKARHSGLKLSLKKCQLF